MISAPKATTSSDAKKRIAWTLRLDVPTLQEAVRDLLVRGY